MKKIIVFVAVAAMVLGCKPDGKDKVDSEKLLQVIKGKQKELLQGCTNIVVIDKDKITAAQIDLPTWIQANKKYFCTVGLAAPKPCQIDDACSANTVIVDLQLIKDAVNSGNEAANIEARASWLRSYGKFICFTSSYYYIFDAHAITSDEMGTAMNNATPHPITFAKLKAEIEKEEGVGYFNLDKYQKYAVLSISKGNVVVSTTDKFTDEFACFSIPFLRSVEKQYCADPNLKLDVYPFEIQEGAVTKYYMGVKLSSTTPGSTTVYLLDYSTDPT